MQKNKNQTVGYVFNYLISRYSGNPLDCTLPWNVIRIYCNNFIFRKVPHCPVSDGKFHQICISLDEKYRIEAYQDSVEHLNDTLPELASDFENRNNLRTRRGTLRLGRAPGMKTATLDGSLFQVNLWDQYPSFRIKRIATNCASGGGTLVGWGDLLKGRMSNAKFDSDSVCPKLEGYNYDEITQNRLI